MSAFGLGSILVVVIGRLWTISYFKHYGLSTGDLEFTVQDFAFRSLEVWISIGLAALALGVAVAAKVHLRQAGTLVLLGEIGIAAFTGMTILGTLEQCVPSGVAQWVSLEGWVMQFSWIARNAVKTGGLGVISGIALGFMTFVVADVWFGPESGRPNAVLLRRGPPRLSCPARPRWKVLNLFGGALGTAAASWHSFALRWHKVLAGAMAVAVIFIYLPRATETLAQIQAKVDLEQGRLPVAVLETTEGPLPGAIASAGDPAKSTPVRVVLAQNNNTYVLDSTQCRTIGQSRVIREGAEIYTKSANVCKVFAIPTSHLKSIEYVTVTGSPPPNDSPSLAEEIGTEKPFDDSVSTKGASDDKSICCTEDGSQQRRVRLYNTVWYKIVPEGSGVLLARATTSEDDLDLIVGVWTAEEGTRLRREPVRGSGPGGEACEIALEPWNSSVPLATEQKQPSTRTPEPTHSPTGWPTGMATATPQPDAVSNSTPTSRTTSFGTAAPEAEHEMAVVVLSNLKPREAYYVAIGSTENKGGNVNVHLEFFPQAFLYREGRDAEESYPPVELSSILGRVELEVSTFDHATYLLTALEDCTVETDASDGVCLRGQATQPDEFALEDVDGEQVHFGVERADGEAVHTVLAVETIVGAGTWRLRVPDSFVGLATVVVPDSQPELVLSLQGGAKDAVQALLMRALDPTGLRNELGLANPIVFDRDTFDASAFALAADWQDGFAELGVYGGTKELRSKLIEASEKAQNLAVRIDAVKQPQQSKDDEDILNVAASLVEERLRERGLEPSKGPCHDLCIRISRIRPEGVEERFIGEAAGEAEGTRIPGPTPTTTPS